MARTYTWKYKDSNRCFWIVNARESGRVGDRSQEPDYFETSWEIEVIREDDLVYDNILSTPYTEPIKLEEILLDFQRYINSAVLGMTKYATIEQKDLSRKEWIYGTA